MKTFLGYFTFAALLALCYVEKINAEAAKRRAGGNVGQHIARRHGAVWTGQRLAVVQWQQ